MVVVTDSAITVVTNQNSENFTSMLNFESFKIKPEKIEGRLINFSRTLVFKITVHFMYNQRYKCVGEVLMILGANKY